MTTRGDDPDDERLLKAYWEAHEARWHRDLMRRARRWEARRAGQWWRLEPALWVAIGTIVGWILFFSGIALGWIPVPTLFPFR
jgi:hypothetical protein